MSNKAILVIDLQNDMTKKYKNIINEVNNIIGWATNNGIHIIYIKHEYTSEKMKKFKSGTKGFELVNDLNIASENIFVKDKGSATSSSEFMKFITENNITEFYLTGGDAIACVKTTTNGLLKLGFKVNAIDDCIISYKLENIPEMLDYYKSKGAAILNSNDLINS